MYISRVNLVIHSEGLFDNTVVITKQLINLNSRPASENMQVRIKIIILMLSGKAIPKL